TLVRRPMRPCVPLYGRLCFFLTRMDVGFVLARHLAERGANLLLPRVALHTERLVIVLELHRAPSPSPATRHAPRRCRGMMQAKVIGLSQHPPPGTRPGSCRPPRPRSRPHRA